MDKEHDTLIPRKERGLLPRPSFPKEVETSKWGYIQKLGPDGRIDGYKERFVAKRFKHAQGIHYQETFWPAFWPQSLQLLFAIMTAHPAKWDIRNGDVKNAFLKGNV